MYGSTANKRLGTKAFAAFMGIVAACLIAAILGGCAASGGQASAQPQNAPAVPPVEVRVASLKGPTSIGIANFIHASQENPSNFDNSYRFSIVGTADEILPALVRGDVDIALIPANAAATVYNKTKGEVQVLNINTLGVLQVVSADTGISSLSDLAGHTVLMTGKGTTPEYTFAALLEKAGIADQVTLEFKSEATELAAALVANPHAIAVLPEPYATSVIAKESSLERRIDLSREWKDVMGEDMATGVTVVRTQFAKDHPQAVAEFMEAQAASVSAANSNPDQAAVYVVEAGIIENASIAAHAIPGCNLVCIESPGLQPALSSYLNALFAQNPGSIGGALPADDFYYAK